MSQVKSTVFVSLNNLFKTDARYDGVVQYKRTGKLPADANRNFKRLYKPFALDGDKLVYSPLGIEVVPKRDIPDLLRRLYDDPQIGLGKGKLGLYRYVQLHFANITRKDVEDFLQSEPRYQLGAPRKQRVNKPFTASDQDSLWCIDLLDMNPYMNAQKSTRFRYILTVIDVFSRHVWLEKLRHKEAVDVRDAFKSVLRRAGHEPKRVLSDNGTEFAGAFEEFLKQREIKVSHSRPHQPQSNSLVERANQEVRRRLKALFIEQKSLTWHTRLPDIEANLNASYNSSIGTSPEHVYNADEDDPQVERTRARLDKRAREKLERYRDTEFAVGDKVRVSMAAMFSSVRAKIKAGNRKSIVVQYTPESYVVTRVIRPRDGGLTRWRYELGTEDGLQLKKGKSEMAQFYASDLLHAEGFAGMTNDTALKLNQAQGGVGSSDVYIWGGNLYFSSV